MKTIYCLLISLLLFSCKSISDNNFDNETLISYESEPCYGKCEVFKLKINQNKTIEYEGIMNVEKIGKYWAKISVNDYNKFKKLISEVDFKITNSVYTSNSTDLHLRVLNIYKKKQDKKILLFDNIPLELKKIEKEVYEIIKKYKLKFKINKQR